MNTERTNSLLLLGCGIFHKEIQWLIQKNNWSLRTDFIDSALHNNLKLLSQKLTEELHEHQEDNTIVFYGCCHPNMDKIVEKADTIRTNAQSCMQMLLGEEEFMRQLENGAYFLLEESVLNWDTVIRQTFGDKEEVIRDIFQGDRKYVLAVKTPCSSDFEKEAKRIAAKVGLPLQWIDVSLECLQSAIEEVIERKQRKQDG